MKSILAMLGVKRSFICHNVKEYAYLYTLSTIFPSLKPRFNYRSIFRTAIFNLLLRNRSFWDFASIVVNLFCFGNCQNTYLSELIHFFSLVKISLYSFGWRHIWLNQICSINSELKFFTYNFWTIYSFQCITTKCGKKSIPMASSVFEIPTHFHAK